MINGSKKIPKQILKSQHHANASVQGERGIIINVYSRWRKGIIYIWDYTYNDMPREEKQNKEPQRDREDNQKS